MTLQGTFAADTPTGSNGHVEGVAVPDEVESAWRTGGVLAYLVGAAILMGMLALAPIALGWQSISPSLRSLAFLLAAAMTLVLGTYRWRKVPGGALAGLGCASSALLAYALAPVLDAQPLAGVWLLGSALLMALVAGFRTALAALVSVTIGGIASWLLCDPGFSVLLLEVETTYGGFTIAPAGLSVGRASFASAIAVLAAAGIACGAWRRGSGKDEVDRSLALERLARGRDALREGQGVTAVAGLGDPRWSLFGIGVAEWELLRIVAVRSPLAKKDLRKLMVSLRGAIIPLNADMNPISRALHGSRSVGIHSAAGVLEGMIQRVPLGAELRERLGPMQGRVVPFESSPDHRGVVFAFCEGTFVAAPWLEDLAAALAIIGADGLPHRRKGSPA